MRNYLSISLLRTIYLTLFQSVIMYGIIGWGSSFKSNFNPLYLLQKKIIKICLHKPIDFPSQKLFLDFNVLNIRQIYYIVLIKFIHKNRNNFELYSHSYETKGMNSLRLFEPKCNTVTVFNHSSNLGPRIYNKFIFKYPNLVNSNSSSIKFKKLCMDFIKIEKL